MAKAAPDVSLEEFADDHGVTVRTVTNWINEGMPHRERRGLRRVVRRQANAWRLERERRREAAKAAGGLWNKEMEAAKKIAVERQLKEIELARERGQSLTIAEAEDFRDRLIGGFASVVAGQLQPFEREMGLEPEAARALTLKMQVALMRGANQLADALEAEADEIEAAALEEEPEVDETDEDADADARDDALERTPDAPKRPTVLPEPDLFGDIGEVPGA